MNVVSTPNRSTSSLPTACTPSVSVAWWPAAISETPSSAASARESSLGSPVSQASSPRPAAARMPRAAPPLQMPIGADEVGAAGKDERRRGRSPPPLAP